MLAATVAGLEVSFEDYYGDVTVQEGDPLRVRCQFHMKTFLLVDFAFSDDFNVDQTDSEL